MRVLSEYIIQFEGLKQGTHFFEFDVDNKFFEEFDCFDYEYSSFKVNLEFTKQSTMLLLKFEFDGFISVPCDRCLDEVDIDVEGEEKLIVKFGNEPYDETEEILVLPNHEYELNVAKYIYEYIQVAMPFKRVHDEGECNQEVIKALERVEQKQEKEVDPRWSSLKDIKIEK